MNKKNNNRKAQLSEEKKQTQLLTVMKMQGDLEIRGSLPKVPDVPRLFLKSNKVYSFARSYIVGSITSSTTVDQFGAINFQLSQFPNSSEFTTLFDQYRIAQVEVYFIPTTTVPTIAPLYTVLDIDDSTVPSNLTDLLQYQTLMQTMPSQQQVRRLIPHFAVASYAGAFTSFSQSLAGQWIDVASPSVQYYGVKYALTATTGGTAAQVYNIQVTGILQFRNPR